MTQGLPPRCCPSRCGGCRRQSAAGRGCLNLAVLFSADAAERYLSNYESYAAVDVDPGADLRALLGFSVEWQRFIPHQVDGRTTVDAAGMAERVTAVVRAAVGRAG